MSALRRRASLLAGLILLGAASASADLRPDELLLLVNANVPASGTLAAQYAKARGVAEARVLILDTPAGEEIEAAAFDARIAKPVRDYLKSPAGQGVRCLVTFYGLPLRVGPRTVSDAERAEVTSLRRLLTDLDKRAADVTKKIDDAAALAGVTSPARPVEGLTLSRQHIQALDRKITEALTASADAGRKQAVLAAMTSAQQASIAAATDALGDAFSGATTAPVTPAEQNAALVVRPRDAAARAALRAALARQGGVFPLAQLVDQQFNWLNAEESDAAVDSELALVRLDDFFRYRWQPNPLHWRAGPGAGEQTKLVMVARIDAPTPPLAAKLIDDTLAAERQGLDGRVAFDSRGIAAEKDGKIDGYGWYDQAIRDAAVFVKAKTKLTVVTDDREALIPPRDVPAVAAYCGWYSLRNYVPSCGFVRGAVGYHVASLELVSLHEAKEKGWVANLIKDGVVATMGAVSEPYLSAFPRPEEFFPLLMTGRPTLAEAYWATCPMTSWKLALIGDPLYRPYARRPAVAVADLPAPLRAWAEKIEAAPATGR